jgi:regulatory protein
MRSKRQPAQDGLPSRDALRSAALRLLGRRDYTTAELREKLRTRGGVDADIDEVLSGLARQDLVSDRRAAAAHVRSAVRLKLRGRARVARELAARGVDADVASDVLSAMPRDAEREAIAAVLLKKRVPARQNQADRRKLFQHLLRRGFSSDVIAEVLRTHDRGGEDG